MYDVDPRLLIEDGFIFVWFRFSSHELVDVPLNEAAEPANSDNVSIHLSDDEEDEIGIDQKSLDSYAMAIENGNK